MCNNKYNFYFSVIKKIIYSYMPPAVLAKFAE